RHRFAWLEMFYLMNFEVGKLVLMTSVAILPSSLIALD
ncbi:MAG: hypothetical protein ACI9LO_001263, partial [Planctomycetota bacterium]